MALDVVAGSCWEEHGYRLPFGPVFSEFVVKPFVFLMGPGDVLECRVNVIVPPFSALARGSSVHQGGNDSPICSPASGDDVNEMGIFNACELALVATRAGRSGKGHPREKWRIVLRYGIVERQ
jgi:hypothetical protein